MEIKESGGLQPTETSTINQMSGNANKVFGDTRHTYFKVLSVAKFRRWVKAHAGDYRYEGLLDSILFIDERYGIYRGARSFNWYDAVTGGAIRILQAGESQPYTTDGRWGKCRQSRY